MKKRVRVLKDMPKIQLVGRELGQMAVGDNAELWAWDAAVLERNGLVNSEKKLTSADLRKLIFEEERDSSPVDLPEFFYSSAAYDILNMRTAGDSEKADELEDQVLALAEIRLSKLSRFAFSPEDTGDIPLEEHFLVNCLALNIENWSSRLGKLLGKTGEEVDKSEIRTIQHVAGDEADIQKQGIFAAKLHAE